MRYAYNILIVNFTEELFFVLSPANKSRWRENAGKTKTAPSKPALKL